MVIRLSQKLATKIGVKPTLALALDANPVADWSGHLFSANRTQYVILTNTASLYSAILYGRGITEDGRFLDRGLGTMREVMVDDGLEFIHRRLVAPSAAELVKLRYFLGCTLAEAGPILGIAPATAEDEWTYARAWLRREWLRSEKSP